MTSTEKLIKKQFGIKSEEDLLKLIESKNDSFFENNFFITKKTYLTTIKKLVWDINSVGDNYSDYVNMAKPGSILESSYTSFGVGDLIRQYRANRKTLENHIRFFIK